MNDKVVITTPVCVAKWPNLVEHEKFDGVSTGKYTLTMMFDEKSKDAIEDAIAKAGGGKGKSPLKQIAADAQYDAGMYYIRAKTGYPIKVFDASNQVVSADHVTQGSEVRAKVSFAPYTQSGGGVTAYLGDVQVLRQSQSSSTDFGPLPEGYEPGEDFAESLPF